MTQSCHPIPDRFRPLAALFDAMDQAWNKTAGHYGFQCHGCQDNCCLSLFFHHTHVEKAYLRHGFSLLPGAEQARILDRARTYCQVTFSGTGAPVSRKAPCPLLVKGRCCLYGYRPMICRMHGLPYELNRPGAAPLRGPGCGANEFQGQDFFDRTPFYTEMAGVEMRFRERSGQYAKLKETVAQMLTNGQAP